MLTIGNFLGGQLANESWGLIGAGIQKKLGRLFQLMVYAFCFTYAL